MKEIEMSVAFTRSRCLAIGVALLFLVGPGVTAAQANESLGRSRIIAELSADWWQWAYSLPSEGHPWIHDGEGDCSVGQQGPVWFLAGTTAPGAVSRSCEVPAGKSLFYPLVNSVFINEPGDCGNEAGCSVEEKRAIFDFVFAPYDTGFVCNLFSSVDGVPTHADGVVTARTQTAPFPVTVNNDLTFLAPGTFDAESIADGYWVLLDPLPAGEHIVQLGGSLCFPDGSSFDVNVTYSLTVLPEDD